MIILLSPAKILNLKPQNIIQKFTLPDFTDRSQILINELRKLTPDKVMELLTVNKAIADLNYLRYIQWHLPFKPGNAKQAVLMFNGEVYHGLMASTFTADDFVFAQKHLRILSGLYGILRPLDLIQPYRLEMGIKLATEKHPNIYKFWGDDITETLNESFRKMKKPLLIHMASHEYAKVINFKKLQAPVIKIEFWEQKDEKYKTIVIYTKKARGMLSRYIIKNKISNPEDIKGFNDEGYIFNPRYSKDNNWVFTRR